MSKENIIESVGEGKDSVVKEYVQRKWQRYIWDTLDKSPEERHFSFKLEAALLTFASLCIIPHS